MPPHHRVLQAVLAMAALSLTTTAPHVSETPSLVAAPAPAPAPAVGMCLPNAQHNTTRFLKLWDDQASITDHLETPSFYIRTIMISS